MRRYLLIALGSVIVVALAVLLFVRAPKAGTIQPFDRLPGGIVAGPTIEAVTDTSATVAVRTAAPAFCQVNYGPTREYGQMRRMTMSGPMTDHRIVLGALRPDTVYHVRLSAIDVKARVYQSDDLTFRTRAGEGGRPPGRNVAALSAGARIASVSSNYGGAGNTGPYGANNAIDEDPSTEWSSNGDGDRAWIEIELARRSQLSAIGFWTRTMGSTAQIEEFEVIVDGKTRLGPFKLKGASSPAHFPVSVSAMRLRFVVRKSSGGNTGALAIEAIQP